MSNSRWRKLNHFLVVSGTGKVQSDFGSFLADEDLDTLENCEIEMNMEIERGEQRNCDRADLIGQPVRRRRRQFRLTFNEPTPQQIFRYIAYKEGSVTSPTGTPANEVQTLSYSGTVDGGTFTISFALEGRSGTTRALPYDATAAQVQAALIDAAASISKVIKPGDVSCSGSFETSGVVVEFKKRLRNANLPLMTINNTSITGGGSIVVAETTPGANYYHTAQRSADGTKPLFSLATGDKAGTIVTRKYGDAVVSSIDLTTDIEQTNVQMTVVIDCNFVPEEPANFTVPVCVNEPPVLAQDVRLEIDSSFENRDLVSDSITLNDNVPLGGAHAFDDIDITRPFQRGDQPTQEFNMEIFADSNHPLYTLAEQEYIEGNEVEVVHHFGNPGNRVSIIAPETKIKPQAQLEGFAGELNESTIRINGTPFGITGLPITYEAYLDQTEAFLQT